MSGFLKEHNAGNFQRLARAEQARVITLQEEAAVIKSATQTHRRLRWISGLMHDGVVIYFTPLYTTIDTRVRFPSPAPFIINDL